MTRFVVDSRVHAVGLAQATRDRLVQEHEHRNPDYFKAKHFGFKGRIPRTIATWRESADDLSFPRGSLPKIRTLVGRAEVEDNRTLGDPVLAGTIPTHRPPSGVLWPHQERLVDAAIRYQNALVRSAAGSGKTTAALAFAARVNLPTLVVVHSTKLFQQWIDRCVAELRVPEKWVGKIRGSKLSIGPITIGMQQTLYLRAADVAPSFGVVIVDEVHRAAARTFLEVVDLMTAKYRLGVTDDERRSDGKEFLVYDLFGPVVAEAGHDELVEQGFIMDVKVRVVPTDFRADWYRTLEDSEKVIAYDKLLRDIAGDRDRNQIAIDLVHEFASAEQTVTFTGRVEHALDLDRMINAAGVPSGFVVGEQEAESDETLRRLRDGRVRSVVGTYQALGTGVDMPKVARGVFAMPIANNVRSRSQFKQYRGRFTRSAAGKSQPLIAYLWDRHVFGVRPLRHLCRWANEVEVEWNGKLVPGRQVLKEIEDDETQE